MPINSGANKNEKLPFSDECIGFFQKKVFGAGHDRLFMVRALTILKQQTDIDLERLREKVDIEKLQSIVSALNREELGALLDEVAEREKFKPY